MTTRQPFLGKIICRRKDTSECERSSGVGGVDIRTMRTKYMSEAALSLPLSIHSQDDVLILMLARRETAKRPPTRPEFSKRRGREELHEAVI